MKPPLRIGIIGMGGFAGSHHRAVLGLEERGLIKLIGTCDPAAQFFAGEQHNWRFASRGVRVFPDYLALLDACHEHLDFVVVPTPIQFHAEMHAAITARGIPAYVEKPPTLDFAELEQMIASDTSARKSALVGFNFIVEKLRLSLKERLLAGEFGAIRGATLVASWPRPASYFYRNDWAGRLLASDGSVVLDSCFGNALSHFVHNLLFWTGAPDLFSWAQIAAVRAELYRAHAIEGADTFFVETDTASGITLRFALTHACSGPSTHCEVVLCDKAVICYTVGGQLQIRWADGRTEKTQIEPFDPLVENHLEYSRYLRGDSPRPVTTLTDCRPFVTLNDLAYISSGRIARIPASQVSDMRDQKEQKDYLHIPTLASLQENFLTRGVWPSSAGWEREPGEVVTPADLPRLHEVIQRMAGA